MTSTITSIDALKKYGEGDIVALPDFGPDQPFVVKLRRPSLMKLAAEGKIPNQLLPLASELFTTGKLGTSNTKKNTVIADLGDITVIIAKASLVEPTYDQLQAAGIDLTDEQLLAIFNYSQTGIVGLKPFRKQSTNDKRSSDGNTV